MTQATYDRQRVGVFSLISEEHVQMLMEYLNFDQLDARQMSIKVAHAKTCRWFLNTSGYKNWLDAGEIADHNGLLWIKGKPGAGKSTLMKFLTAHSRKTMRNAVVVSFFFNARGEELEKSTTVTYRSLLVQLFEQLPKLKCVLGHLKVPEGTITSTFHWSVALLEVLLKHAIQNLGDTSIVCFIDALEECEEDQIRAMISFFERVGSHCTMVGRDFSSCFASRHYPPIYAEKAIELVLEGHEGHEQDIASYLNTQLKIGKTKRAEQIRSRVLEKASGVFM
ncbi:hypothetical protein BU23DRAFT_572613 [Bimuria novae-zelandiae CBS 107.79]|uniref:Nephrocystin 3-like N-terminal domain-containing protein n=1 Tax=Bimuria novae-zelandiae CBS 107.79 TaxID=1447943 RepID=A0A6A5UUL4_9PLEO|nr:hypothetical protein BU23DRAFT_572613 [Bimuria novae-zelandiae CBS 107.79]